MEAIHDSAVEAPRQFDLCVSGTAWPYCLSMSAALPENMRGGSDMVLCDSATANLLRVLCGIQYACVDAPTSCSDCRTWKEREET